MRRLIPLLGVLLLLSVRVKSQTMPADPPIEPEIISIFPLGGQRSSVVQVEVRGKGLEGAYAAWLTTEGLRAEVKKVEEVKPAEGKKEDKRAPLDYQVSLQIEVNASAELGPHPLRLVSPRGVSNAVLFHICDEPSIMEVQIPHEAASEAQPVSFPVVVNGRISTPGQVDYYGFNVAKAQELKFELTTSREAAANRFRPQLTLYQIQGSWFDPTRAIRLAFMDQVEGDTVIIVNDPREKSGTRLSLRYQFNKQGRYFLEVGSLFGKGGLDQIYQLRIVPTGKPSSVQFDQPGWRERTFTRRLEPDWLRTLWSRTVKQPERESEPGGSASLSPTSNGGAEHPSVPATRVVPSASLDFATFREKEPNTESAQALEISIPALIEGAIDRVNDVDTYKFKVGRGQRLAFEIETPKTTVPRFNPLLTVLDSKEAEVLTNIQRAPEFKTVTTPYLKSINPKVISTFEQEGQYYLRIRDITSRKGDPNFVYRILIRPQIPHIGEIELETRTRGLEDGKADPCRVNLIAGEAKKLTLITEHEEGFFNPSNVISFFAEGLPEGVESFAAASSYSVESRVREGAVFKEESFLPKKQNVTIVLQARVDAPVTRMPVSIRFFAQAIVEGKLGPRLAVTEVPVMVLKPPEIAVAGQQSEQPKSER
jgi:hypothetical protein